MDRLISSPIGSKDGIHVTVDKPYGKNPGMNVYQPSVLRQYFSINANDKECREGYINRYSYGTGTGSNTLCIDPTNFKTRPFTNDIELLASQVHQFVLANRTKLNLDKANLGKCFNHCTIIPYYAGEGLKKEALLSKHCDNTYSVHTGKFVHSANSQVEDTPTFVYSLGTTRTLNFYRRHIVKGKRGNKWMDDTDWSRSFELSNNSIWILNPIDEKAKGKYQYQHGGVKVKKGEMSVGLAFRIVKNIEEYDVVNDIRAYDTSGNHDDNSKIYKRFMSHQGGFHKNLVTLMNQILD